MGLSPVQLVTPMRFGDSRGWFTEAYSEATFATLGITSRFVQDNHSLSAQAYTVRGLHLQAPPHAQDKLVRCVRGRIFDVALDVRRGSPTYGAWTGTELSAANGHQLFVPAGFAHAFLSLEPDCEVIYKVSDFYAPGSEIGIRWDTAAIAWPLPPGTAPTLSTKDAALPSLDDFDSPFPYCGDPLVPLA